MKLSNEHYKELRILFLSFHFFSVILQSNNGVIDKDFKKVFRRVRDTIKNYSKKYGDKICKDLNLMSKSIVKEYEIDMALAGVTVIALYYDMVKNPIYSPMSYKQIMEVQLAHLDKNEKIESNTLEYCEEMVRLILNYPRPI